MGVLGHQVLLCAAVLNKLDVLTRSVVTLFSLFVRLTEVYWTSAEAKSSTVAVHKGMMSLHYHNFSFLSLCWFYHDQYDVAWYITWLQSAEPSRTGPPQGPRLI